MSHGSETSPLAGLPGFSALELEDLLGELRLRATAAKASHARMQALLDAVVEEYPEKPSEPGAWWLPAHLGGGAPSLETASELDRADVAARRAKRAAKAAARR